MTTPTERALQREIDRLNSILRQLSAQDIEVAIALDVLNTNLALVVPTTESQTYYDNSTGAAGSMGSILATRGTYNR